jgi:hypothetical protein
VDNTWEDEPDWIIPFYLVDAYGPECYAAPHVEPDDPLVHAHPDLAGMRGWGGYLAAFDPMPWQPAPVPPDDRCTPQGITLSVVTADGRWLRWAQPLVDVSRLACGVWIAECPELMHAAETAMYADSECGTLYAVAVAMLHAAGPGAQATVLTRRLAAMHPAEDAPRRQRCQQWWDDLRDNGFGCGECG